jgi:uncharacterized protein YndB with AHSA1/START domain
MSHQFEEPAELHFDLSPETVWEAIATGPGLSSWFMGATDVNPEEGVVRTTMGSYAQESTIGAYEPGHHFSFKGAESSDGRFFAMEFLIEARSSGSTVLRIVSSGFLPDDDWEAEFEAMLAGGRMYRHTLVEYLAHFAGRPGIAVTASAPFGDLDRRWDAMKADLGVSGSESPGDNVTLTPTGLPAIEGVVDSATWETLGVRSDDALYRFYRGYYAAGVGHHLFATSDGPASTLDWQGWLDSTAP